MLASRSARGSSAGTALGRRDADRTVRAQPARGALRELRRVRPVAGGPGSGSSASTRPSPAWTSARGDSWTIAASARWTAPPSGAAHSATPP